MITLTPKHPLTNCTVAQALRALRADIIRPDEFTHEKLTAVSPGDAYWHGYRISLRGRKQVYYGAIAVMRK